MYLKPKINNKVVKVEVNLRELSKLKTVSKRDVRPKSHEDFALDKISVSQQRPTVQEIL